MKPALDHIVIGARTLAQGVAYVSERLGVVMPFGGEHPQMGTHNHLMQLGADTFLEVIAIHPEGKRPSGPRWFGLDDPFVRSHIARQPALLTWVVNTGNISAFLNNASLSFGQPQRITRGTLCWDFAVPDDGRLVAGGLLPYVIQWHTAVHPAAAMADRGCRLQGLEIHHPCPQWITAILRSIGATELAVVHELPPNAAPFLVAPIETPNGITHLQSSDGMPF